MKFDVIGIGHCTVDCICVGDDFPKNNTKTLLKDLVIDGGGPTATALVTLSKLGAETSFIGKVGDDYFGNIIKNDLQKENIDLSNLRMDEDATSQFSLVIVEKNSGKRTILYTKGDVLPLTRNDIDLDFILDCKYLYLDGHQMEASIIAAKLARRNNKKVIFDAGSIKPGTNELLKYVDILIASEDFAKAYSKTNNIRNALTELSKNEYEIIVITLGEKGCVGIHEGKYFKEPGFKIKAIDTTGAGDVFHGAFIYGLLQGWNIKDTLKFSNAVAALKCMKIGGRRGIPTLETIFNFLKKNGVDWPHQKNVLKQ